MQLRDTSKKLEIHPTYIRLAHTVVPFFLEPCRALSAVPRTHRFSVLFTFDLLKLLTFVWWW